MLTNQFDKVESKVKNFYRLIDRISKVVSTCKLSDL